MSATPTTERSGRGPSAVESHPCFSAGHAVTTSRLHLPVAPRCNVQCRFCDRAFDCVNESRPGVTAALLSPEEALERVDILRDKLPNLGVVGIAGPGDPLANPKETFATFALVKARHPDLSLCLSTNGLALPAVVDDIVDLGVSHLTVTVNAVDPDAGAGIYAWVRYEGRARTGADAARILWERQQEGIAEAVARGLTVKINTILVPGVNDGQVEAIARECAALGVHYMNLIPLLPVKGTPLAAAGEPPKELVTSLREKAKIYLPQLAHCARCRADAAGLLGRDVDLGTLRALGDPAAIAAASVNPAAGAGSGAAASRSSCPSGGCGGGAAFSDSERSVPSAPASGVSAGALSVSRRAFLAAAATREGLLVNRHLGEVDRLFVFRVAPDGSYETLDIRPLPPGGGGDDRWAEVAKIVGDCDALLVAGIGAPPRRVLEQKGVTVHVVEGLISEALGALYAGKNLSFLGRRPPSCGSGCSGSASRGCGCG